MKSIVFASLLAVALATPGLLSGIISNPLSRWQAASIKGRLTCNGEPAANIRLKLYDVDSLPDTDDLMKEGFTGTDGTFTIAGKEKEWTIIDPKLNIYHRCGHDGKCPIKVEIMIPKNFVNDGEVAEKTFDLGESTWPRDSGMTKTKSEYGFSDAVAKIRAHRTDFQLNLDKMLASVSKSLTVEREAPVAMFNEPLHKLWPEPDEPKRPRRSHSSLPVEDKPQQTAEMSCWSSPANILLEDQDISSPEGSAYCWSAPEFLVDGDSDTSEGYERRRTVYGRKPETVFARSYPQIDSPDQDSEGESRVRCVSPSCQRGDPSDSEDEEEHQAQAEVWPEEEMLYRGERVGWNMNGAAFRIPRSRSVYQELRSYTAMPHSRSAFEHLAANYPDERDESPYGEGSSQSHMDSDERCAFDSRSQWIRTASGNSQYQIWKMGAEESPHHLGPQPEIRRSATVAEGFRHVNGYSQNNQQRRRLPKRPEFEHVRQDTNYGTIPTSVSMYGRMMGDYHPEYDCSIRHLPTSDSHDLLLTAPRFARPSDYQLTSNGYSDMENDPPRAPSRQERPSDLQLRAASRTQNSARSPLNPISPADDPYADIATPMSPPLRMLPPAHHSSGGRRLPQLPVALLRDLPPTIMGTHNGQQSLLGHLHGPTTTPAAAANNDHRLCFGMDASMMGRSALEDSYYEEDGMNGNSGYPSTRKNRKSFFSPEDSSGVSSCAGSESQNPTHRVQTAFYPRHSDELLLEMGDAVHVDRTCEDNWCYGTNLRTGQHGIFPSSVVCEIDLVDEICQGALPSNAQKVLQEERDTFYLTLLGSIEVGHHKGNDVLIQAINKVLGMYSNRDEVLVPQTVLLEVSFRGVHVIDKKKKNFFQCPTFDFFYSLQNISFCGSHPKQLKYFGFITKHPLLPRFACHVFVSNESTQQIVESIGRAFKRSYDEYMAFAHPTEDIYLE
ncbi:unnamed protein product, partial [Mesorhabditis spiculigera]